MARAGRGSAGRDPPLRLLARRLLLLVLLLALALNLLAIRRIVTDPRYAPVAERALAEIRAELETALAARADPDRIEAALGATLAEEPVDWVRADALAELAAARGLALSPALAARLAEAEARDRGPAAFLGACWACIRDRGDCPLSGALLCNVAVELTPVGDARSLLAAAADWQAGREVDRIDLALATIGAAATVGAVFTAGSAYAAKLGAGALKAARAAGTLRPGLAADLARQAEGLVDLGRLPDAAPALRPAHLAQAADAARLAALGAAMADLGAAARALGPVRALRSLRHVESLDELRALRRAGDAMGPRAFTALELLGPARVFRATARVTRAGRQVLAGWGGVLAALAGLVHLALQRSVTAGLRGLARGGRRRDLESFQKT